MPRITLNDNSFGALMMTGASLSFAVKAGDEVIVVAIRDADGFEERAKDGVVNWLDERRPML